jgi:hypothetical protein
MSFYHLAQTDLLTSDPTDLPQEAIVPSFPPPPIQAVPPVVDVHRSHVFCTFPPDGSIMSWEKG